MAPKSGGGGEGLLTQQTHQCCHPETLETEKLISQLIIEKPRPVIEPLDNFPIR